MFRYWRTNAPNAISEEEKVGLRAGKLWFFSLKRLPPPTHLGSYINGLQIRFEAVFTALQVFESCFQIYII